jgi:hypothetical protein
MGSKYRRTSFEQPRRRLHLPFIPIFVAILVCGGLYFLWSRGAEQPQVRVEKVIPSERLGK